MASVATCPHCGADLYALRDFAVGPLTVENGVVVKWRGQMVKLTRSQRLIVMTLARADGAPVSRSVLAEATGYEGDQPESLVKVLVSRLRKAFLAVDPAFDAVQSEFNVGFRWSTDEGHLLAA